MAQRDIIKALSAIQRLEHKVARLRASEKAWEETAVERGKVIEKLNRLIRPCDVMIADGLRELIEQILDDYEEKTTNQHGPA